MSILIFVLSVINFGLISGPFEKQIAFLFAAIILAIIWEVRLQRERNMALKEKITTDYLYQVIAEIINLHYSPFYSKKEAERYLFKRLKYHLKNEIDEKSLSDLKETIERSIKETSKRNSEIAIGKGEVRDQAMEYFREQRERLEKTLRLITRRIKSTQWRSLEKYLPNKEVRS